MNIAFVSLRAPRPHHRNIGSFVHDMAVALNSAGHHVEIIAPVRVCPNNAIYRSIFTPAQILRLPFLLREWHSLWRSARGRMDYEGVVYRYKRFFSTPAVDRARASGMQFAARQHDWLLEQVGMVRPQAVIGHFLESAPLVQEISGSLNINAAVYLHESLARLRQLISENSFLSLMQSAAQMQIITNSRRTLREATEAGFPSDNCVSVPPGVDGQCFRILPERYDDTLDAFKLLYIARFGSNKRHDLLLECLGLWQKLNLRPALKLTLLGDDEATRFDLIKKANRLGLNANVKIMVTASRNDIYQALRTSHAFISPSEYESFGMALLEAAAAGLPICTGHNTGLAEELAAKGIVLHTFDQFDVHECLHAIRKLVTDYPGRVRYAERIKQQVRGEYSWERFAAALEAAV